ncbi:hypothetical protein ZWY2020_030168 [Hordeum vulgare]|nr:hypothetical protein ZWY2020_030168 [Hordeum vulgare]
MSATAIHAAAVLRRRAIADDLGLAAHDPDDAYWAAAPHLYDFSKHHLHLNHQDRARPRQRHPPQATPPTAPQAGHDGRHRPPQAGARQPRRQPPQAGAGHPRRQPPQARAGRGRGRLPQAGGRGRGRLPQGGEEEEQPPQEGAGRDPDPLHHRRQRLRLPFAAAEEAAQCPPLPAGAAGHGPRLGRAEAGHYVARTATPRATTIAATHALSPSPRAAPALTRAAPATSRPRTCSGCSTRRRRTRRGGSPAARRRRGGARGDGRGGGKTARGGGGGSPAASTASASPEEGPQARSRSRSKGRGFEEAAVDADADPGGAQGGGHGGQGQRKRSDVRGRGRAVAKRTKKATVPAPEEERKVVKAEKRRSPLEQEEEVRTVVKKEKRTNLPEEKEGGGRAVKTERKRGLPEEERAAVVLVAVKRERKSKAPLCGRAVTVTVADEPETKPPRAVKAEEAVAAPRGMVDRWSATRYAAAEASLLGVMRRFGARPARPCPRRAEAGGAQAHRRHGPPRPPPQALRRQGQVWCVMKANGNLEKQVLSLEEKYVGMTRANDKLEEEVLFLKLTVDTEYVLHEKYETLLEKNTRLEQQVAALSTSFLSLKEGMQFLNDGEQQQRPRIMGPEPRLLLCAKEAGRQESNGGAGDQLAGVDGDGGKCSEWPDEAQPSSPRIPTAARAAYVDEEEEAECAMDGGLELPPTPPSASSTNAASSVKLRSSLPDSPVQPLRSCRRPPPATAPGLRLTSPLRQPRHAAPAHGAGCAVAAVPVRSHDRRRQGGHRAGPRHLLLTDELPSFCMPPPHHR